jgi:hypothetical protein
MNSAEEATQVDKGVRIEMFGLVLWFEAAAAQKPVLVQKRGKRETFLDIHKHPTVSRDSQELSTANFVYNAMVVGHRTRLSQ